MRNNRGKRNFQEIKNLESGLEINDCELHVIGVVTEAVPGFSILVD